MHSTHTGMDMQELILQELILQELQKANSRLDEFVVNLQSIKSRLSSVEDHNANSTSNSSLYSNEEASGKTQRSVPSKVLVC